MAQITGTQRDQLSAELQRLFSSTRATVPLLKPQLRTAIDIFDAALENTETTILANVSAPANAWLLANQTLARFIIECVAQKRREVL